ncbi:hypothetical protein ACMA5I_05800 [Paracoccaceae bacterium GXU_MW_L88]
MTQGKTPSKTGTSQGEPDMTEATRAEKATREARLAEALRENLKRRKAQARGRKSAGDQASEE